MARSLASKHDVWRYRSTTNILCLLLVAFMGYQIGRNMNLHLPQHHQQQILMHENQILHRLAQIASTARLNSINEAELPYSCGVVLFYHVPCTGGSTMNNYLLEQSTSRNGTSEYFTFWGDPNRRWISSVDQTYWMKGKLKEANLLEERENIQTNFINGVDKLVQNISMNEWRIAHAHHNSLHLNESESILSNWRSIVESNGCHFVASVLFRDALSHSLAVDKNRKAYNASREEWIGHLHTKDQLSVYETQLDYFLYNKITRNPHAVDAQVKVDRALQLLARHFEIVAVGGHDKFKERIQQFTGWEDKEMPRKNSHSGTLDFTKEEVENMQKLLEENGDIDFIEKAKLLFDNPMI